MLLSSLISATSDSRSRSRYLRLMCWIRMVALMGQISAVLVAQLYLQLQLNYLLLWIIIGGLIFLTVFSWNRSGQQKVLSESAYGFNLALEVLGFSVLIYLSGGATNPFVFYYLVPLSMGVATLSRHNAWLFCGLCIVVYTLLLFQYQPLALFDMSHGMAVSWRSPHIIGMWMNFIFSAVLITYFVSRMADQIRSQERELADRDQQQREDEHLLAMGTFAAGTAHELGTPLSSLTIILQDLSQQLGLEPDQKSELEIACGEVDRCKKILHRLVSAAQASQNSSPRKTPISELMNQLIDQAKNLFANAEIDLKLAEGIGELSLQTETAIEQSLLNLVANSIESSLQNGSPRIQINVDRNRPDSIQIIIRDFGQGVSVDILSKLGSRLVSDKAEGLGMGYFLANASINRMGGQLAIRNNEQGGAETRVELPLVENAL